MQWQRKQSGSVGTDLNELLNIGVRQNDQRRGGGKTNCEVEEQETRGLAGRKGEGRRDVTSRSNAICLDWQVNLKYINVRKFDQYQHMRFIKIHHCQHHVRLGIGELG